jgi:hypothetical protein
MLGEDVGSRMVPVGSDHPNKLANCDDGVRHQMVQLYLNHVENISENWMQRYTNPAAKKSSKMIASSARGSGTNSVLGGRPYRLGK